MQKYAKIRGNASIVKTEKMFEKCVVFGCSNSRNIEKGISMHKIPSDNDPKPSCFGMVSLSYVTAKEVSNIGRFSLARS